MTRSIVLILMLLCLLSCSPTPVEKPSGPIAKFGTIPTIDGVFADGEWDDAEVVLVNGNQQFRLKHDSTNLYLALNAGGGNLWFNKDAGLHVLHWSAQLGSALYEKSDSTTQTRDKPIAYELWGLQNEPQAVISKALADYLAENGWTASISAMGRKMQSEFAISFDWLGVTTDSERFVETPGIHIGAGLMLSRSDPEAEEIIAMSIEERMRQYPSLYWPKGFDESNPLNRGTCPDTIRVDPTEFGKIWIDMGK